MGVPEDVTELLGPVVANLGVDLVDVEHTGAVLRLIVDQEGGISTDMLARINRLVSPMLDEHDPIVSRYTLEVSSPGVERKLKTMDHFRRSVGETILVKLAPGSDVRRVKGELINVVEDTFTVRSTDVDGVELAETEERLINYEDVIKARTVFDWGPTPKQGGSKNGKKKKSGRQVGQGHNKKTGQSKAAKR